MKCLNCDRHLALRKFYGPSVSVVVCKCGVRYDPDTVKHADPAQWEKVRRNRLFLAETTDDQVILRLQDGLGLNPKREKLKKVKDAS